MQYIIYSNGANGYGFYKSSDNFQEKYKRDIEDLYTQSNIVNPDPNCDSRSMRFAPLNDKYLISVIYRNCTGNNESRRMIAGVNFVFDYEELEKLISAGSKILIELLQRSDNILENEGYKFTADTYSLSEFQSVLSENCKSALLAAAYSAMDYADNGNYHNYRLQSFVGYKTLSEAFEMMLWMFNSVPVVFWKHLSVYVGATKASETMDITLALIEENALEYIDKQDEYSGTMPTPKVVQYGEGLSGGQYIPAYVNKYMVLSNNDLSLLKKVFQCTDDKSKFWELVTKLADDVKSENITKNCVDVLGEELTIKCIEKNIISEAAFVLEASANRSAFKGCNKLLELADSKIKQNQKAEDSQKGKASKKKNDKKSKSKKKTQEASAEKAIDKSKEQEDTSGIFGFVSALLKNRFLLYITIAVLSVLVIVSANAFAIEMSVKLFSEGLKIALLKTVPFSKFIFTIIGLNIVNIPAGFTFVASVIELFKMRSDNKRR